MNFWQWYACSTPNPNNSMKHETSNNRQWFGILYSACICLWYICFIIGILVVLICSFVCFHSEYKYMRWSKIYENQELRKWNKVIINYGSTSVLKIFCISRRMNKTNISIFDEGILDVFQSQTRHFVLNERYICSDWAIKWNQIFSSQCVNHDSRLTREKLQLIFVHATIPYSIVCVFVFHFT